MTDARIRVYFELPENDWHGGGLEGLWAEPLEASPSGTVYRLLNSPYYARGISYLDVVRAVQRQDGGSGLAFAGIIDHSGHSTYMILTPARTEEFESLWNRLSVLGCTYESAGIEKSASRNRELLSVDVPPSSDIHAAYAILEEGEKNNVWTFQEGHCAHVLGRNSRSKY